MNVVCPCCATNITVTVSIAALDGTGKPVRKGLAASPEVQNALREFLGGYGTGRVPSSWMWTHYVDERLGNDWPELTEQTFFRGLGHLGLKQWRSGTERGWVVPETLAGGDDVPVEEDPENPAPRLTEEQQAIFDELGFSPEDGSFEGN